MNFDIDIDNLKVGNVYKVMSLENYPIAIMLPIKVTVVSINDDATLDVKDNKDNIYTVEIWQLSEILVD